MALPGALRVVSQEGQRFLCFCDGGSSSSSSSSSSIPRLHVTNGSEFWSCEITSEKLDGPLSQKEPASPDDCISKLREFLGCQTPILSVRDSRATVEFQDGRQSMTFDLHKVPLSEARTQLQDLMFGLVAQVHQLEKRLEESATAALPLGSPEKNAFRSRSLFASEISPSKYRGGASTGQATTKKRLPGESLINPGFKSKKTPTGVDFEDV